MKRLRQLIRHLDRFWLFSSSSSTFGLWPCAAAYTNNVFFTQAIILLRPHSLGLLGRFFGRGARNSTSGARPYFRFNPPAKGPWKTTIRMENQANRSKRIHRISSNKSRRTTREKNTMEQCIVKEICGTHRAISFLGRQTISTISPLRHRLLFLGNSPNNTTSNLL